MRREKLKFIVLDCLSLPWGVVGSLEGGRGG